MTTENNKRIAEFMGYEIMYRPNSNGFIEISDTELCDVDDLEYHKSWDWIIPVVREVLTIANINLVNYCVEELKFCVLDNDIDGAFEEVVEFINYLNKTNNN